MVNVFLSSTYRDLIEHRRAVDDAVRRLCQTRAMELFGARPDEPTEVCKEEILRSHILVGIYAHRYGHIPEGTSTSITEQEFDFALARKLKCFCYFVASDYPWLDEHREVDKTADLKRFKDKIKKAVAVDRFTTPDDLARRVVTDITNWLWTEGAVPGAYAEAPEYFAPFLDKELRMTHAFPLVGREDLVGALNEFYNGNTRIALLSGVGGVGKTKALYEWARQLSIVTKENRVLFLQDSQVIDSDLLRQLPVCRVIVIDNAHLKENTGGMITRVARDTRAPKLLLCTRPHATPTLCAAIYREPLKDEEFIRLPELQALSRDQTKQLASSILDTTENQILAPLISMFGDSPLMTVMGAQYVKKHNVFPQLLSNEDSFRKGVLDGFLRDTLTVTQSAVPAIPAAQFLNLLAALNPFPLEDKTLRDHAAGFLSITPDTLVPALEKLLEAGVLIRVGSTARFSPDVLADAFLESACFAEAAEISTGYASRLFNHFSSVCPGVILRNLAEVDWRMRFRTTKDILADIWQILSSACEGDDIRGVVAALDLVAEIAYSHPDKAMDIIQSPLRRLSAFKQGEFSASDYVIDHIEDQLITIMGRIGAYRKHTTRCADELWKLGRDGEKQRYANKGNRAIEAVHTLARYGRLKDPEVNRLVFEQVSEWTKEPGWHDHNYSVFDVLDHVLKKEDSENYAEGLTITMTSFGIRPVPWRLRVVSLIMALGKGGPDKVSIRALESLSSAADSPRGMMGRKIGDSEYKAWIPEQQAALAGVLEIGIVRGTPVVRDKARFIATQHRHESELKESCEAILVGVEETFDTRLIRSLRGELFNDFIDVARTGNDDDSCNKAQNAATECHLATARELLGHVQGASDLKKTLERHIVAMSAAGVESSPHYLIAALSSFSLDTCADLCRLVASDGRSELNGVLGQLLLCLRKKNKLQASRAVTKILRHDIEGQALHVAYTFAHREWPDDASKTEVRQLRAGLKSHHPRVVAVFLSAVHRMALGSMKTAIQILKGFDIGESQELCNSLFQNFGRDGIAYERLTAKTIAHLLGTLVPVRELRSRSMHDTGRFLDYVVKKDPGAVVDLFVKRIIHSRTLAGGDYRVACMSGEWPDFGLTDKSKRISLLKIIRDEALRSDSAGTWCFTDLFWAVGSVAPEEALSVLSESLEGATENTTLLLADLMDNENCCLIVEAPEFHIRLANNADSHGEACRKKVFDTISSHILCSPRSGDVGQPFPLDVALRDGANAILQRHDIGSGACKLYTRISQEAEAGIIRRINDGEELRRG